MSTENPQAPDDKSGTPPAEPPKPGTPEYDAKMASLADSRMGTTPGEKPAAKPEKPAEVPDKFWDAEKGEVRWTDLAKSYKELESKFGQKPPAQPPAKPGTDLAVDKPDQQSENPQGLDMDALSAEYDEKGSLSEETYAKLEKSGLSRATVDRYIEGQQALAAQYAQVAHEAAGGAEQFTAMQQWAGSHMTPQEAKAYNDAVTSGDTAKMKLAIAGLRARYEAEEGTRPNLVHGENGTGDVAGAYNSMAELRADQRKPEYRKDPAFRARVDARAKISKF